MKYTERLLVCSTVVCCLYMFLAFASAIIAVIRTDNTIAVYNIYLGLIGSGFFALIAVVLYPVMAWLDRKKRG